MSNNNEDSSDSEIESHTNTGPSVDKLKQMRFQLQTCLSVTEELTGLTILQSTDNIMLSAPALEREAPISEEGLWHDVFVECRIYQFTFSMYFYKHQPSRQFAPPAYRNLRVRLPKVMHAKELSQSALVGLTTPSDVFEVLRSYARAHRSRRNTLARLANKYDGSVSMEALPEGGYLLTCGERLSVSWVLRNSSSGIAFFYHRLHLDFENRGENYVKTIEQAYKKLCDPKLNTNGRTSLLAKIIDTCLEARGQVGSDSGAETQNSPADREADQADKAPVKPPEIMNPSKSLPKESKPKGKENRLANKRKRSSATDTVSGERTAKKAKTS